MKNFLLDQFFSIALLGYDAIYNSNGIIIFQAVMPKYSSSEPRSTWDLERMQTNTGM